MTPAEEKAARLAKALRENLKRRKAQARGEPAALLKPDPTPDPGPPDTD